MTNRTREIFEFAQMEPMAIADMTMMLRDCDQEEVDDIEQVADNILAAIVNLGSPDSEFTELIG